MNQSLFLESRNLFVNPPVDFEDWGNYDYDKAFGIDKYCYNAYRHFILPYLTDPTNQTIVDIKPNNIPHSTDDITSNTQCKIVLEVNSNYCKYYNIKVGDKVEYYL